MKTKFTFKTTIVAIAIAVSFSSCKKGGGNEDIPVPVDQQTYAQLSEQLKISFYQMREFSFKSETRDGITSTPAVCVLDNSFFVSNGDAQIYYGTLQCTAIDVDFQKAYRLAQKFSYSNATLTIGNLFKDNGISGDITYTVKSVDEAHNLLVISSIENNVVVERTFNFSGKQTSIPAKYK